MHCPSCHYPLWNLRDRLCPECGTPFLPSQFDLVGNAVRFACPHCDQGYYGTGERGHLVPRAFTCVRCHRPIDMDEMVLSPTAGVEEWRTAPEQVPWLERRRLGGFRAWFRTVGMSMGRPGDLARTAEGTPIGPALGFALVTTIISGIVGAAIPLAFFAVMAVLASGAAGARGAGAGFGTLLVFALWLGGMLLGAMAGLCVWAAVAHGLLRLTGRTHATLGRTVQAIAYACGPNVLTAVPCVGAYLSPIATVWWCIGSIVAVREAQRVGTVRATIAVGGPPALVALGLVALILLPIFSATATWSSYRATRELTRARTLEFALLSHASANQEWPTHLGELLASGALSTTDVIIGYASPSDATTARIGATTLEDFMLMSPDERAAVAAGAGASLPAGTVAHRVGDVIATWHGIDPVNPDPRLWILFSWPDPDVDRSAGALDVVVACRADGTVEAIETPDFPPALAAQNTLRAGLGLAPLPHPRTITHGAPAVAGP